MHIWFKEKPVNCKILIFFPWYIARGGYCMNYVYEIWIKAGVFAGGGPLAFRHFMKSNIFWEKWGKAPAENLQKCSGFKMPGVAAFFRLIFFQRLEYFFISSWSVNVFKKKMVSFFLTDFFPKLYRLKLSYNNLENFHQLFNTGILTKAISLTRLCAFDKNPKTLTRFYYSDVGFYIKSKNFDCTVQCTLYISPIL